MDGEDLFALFLEKHEAQLVSSAVPQQFWQTLFHKLRNETFDAGQNFIMAKMDDGNMTVVVKREDGIDCQDACHIYLIDHAWTFEAKNAKLQLRLVPGLLERISALVGLETEYANDEAIEEVCRLIWKYLRTYSMKLSNDDPPVAFWYVMDEFGSAIQHSSEPNFRAVPFFNFTGDAAYTLLFPIRDLDEGDQVFIDYVEGADNNDEKALKALLVPWSEESFVDEPSEQFEPGDDYFLSGTQKEKLPATWDPMPAEPSVLKVFTEYPLVQEYLKDPGFVFVDNEDEADVLWLTRHFDNYKELAEMRPRTFINQFPCERVITTKDLLAIVARRTGKSPAWLPLTFNLITELPIFVGTFQRREAARLDNHWICKPWNLARALDTTVTDNLNCILRLPFSGPKIAQKYAENPVLFKRDVGLVKFDVRYVILLESTAPLKLYCHRKFYLRFANKPFELCDLWDYEKHFTVMNYREEATLHRMLCDEFRTEFEAQYPAYSWEAVEKSIMDALTDVFTAACSVGPPKGLAPCPQSRALYAADFILTWNYDKIQPLLLEINFGPDCTRACQYYPDFYDDIFNLLFKSKINSDQFLVL